MPVCPVAAANGVDDVRKLRAPHAGGYWAYHPGKHTAPTRPAAAVTPPCCFARGGNRCELKPVALIWDRVSSALAHLRKQPG